MINTSQQSLERVYKSIMNNQFLSFMKAIYERPKMYLEDKSFSYLRTFITGMKVGISCADYKKINIITSQTSEFSNYLNKKYNYDKSYEEIIWYILANKDDILAFDIFFDEYIKFLKEIYNIDFSSIKTTIIGFDENGEAIWE